MKSAFGIPFYGAGGFTWVTTGGSITKLGLLIIGHSNGLKHNTFLMSDVAARDFKLTLEVKLQRAFAPDE